MANSIPSTGQYNEDSDEFERICEDLKQQINAHMSSLNGAIEDVHNDMETVKRAVKSNREAMVNVVDHSTNSIMTEIDNHGSDLQSALSGKVAVMEQLLHRLQQICKSVSEPERQNLFDEIKQNLESEVSCKHSTRPIMKFYPSAILRNFLSGNGKVGILKYKKHPLNDFITTNNFRDDVACMIESRRGNSSHDTNSYSCSSSFASMSCGSLVSSATVSVEELETKINGKCRHITLQQLPGYTCSMSNVSVYERGMMGSQMGFNPRHRSVEELSYTSEPCSHSETSSCSDNCAYPFANTRDMKQLNVNHLSANNRRVQNNDLATNFNRNITTNHSAHEETDVDERSPLSCRFFDLFETKRHKNPCVIPDFTWLDDGRIVLADHYHNNIQLFDDQMRFVTEEPCTYPMGVCSIYKDFIAVTLRRNGSVAIFKAEADHLTFIRGIDAVCDYYLWNVVYKSACLYVMCDENNVHNLDLYGTRRRIIRTGISTECGYIRYFDVSDDGLLLFLCTEMGLICISREGQQLWKFTMENLPMAICEKNRPTSILESVHFYDNRLLATHWTQSVILEISINGDYVKHLITSGIENPRAIDIRNGKLAFTQFHPTMKENRKRTVKIYKISSDSQM